MNRSLGSVAAAAVLLAAFVGRAAPARAADAVGDFYRGKTLDFVVGAAASSGYDVWARLVARHIGAHIPGHPSFVIRNMPGAGHIVAANYLYNEAAHDGSVLAMISRDLPTQELLGNKSIHFKMAEFNWLGSPQSSHRICVAAAGAKVQSAEDLLSDELIVAGAGGAITTTPILLRELLGMKFKVVLGYPSAAAGFLAIERREVEGICQNLAGTEAIRPGWIAAGKLEVLFNMEKKPIEGVPGIKAPSIYAFTRTDEQRQVIAFFNSSVELGWPVLTTPGVPKQRVAALRQAFDATMKDPAFLADAAKLKFDIIPQSGEELTEVVGNLFETPKAVIEKTAAIVGKYGN